MGRPLDKRIITAYHSLVYDPGGWVMLSRLHDHLGEHKHDIDPVLIGMLKTRRIRLIAEVNQKMLTDYDRECAVMFAGEPKHLYQLT